MADLARFIVFKPVGHDYVYRTPNAWGFGAGRHYLVNQQQKAEILRTITSSSRHVFWVTGISWVALSILLVAGALMWVDRTNHATLSNILICVALISSLYVALLISRQVLSRRLQPVLAILPATNERITKADMHQGSTSRGIVSGSSESADDMSGFDANSSCCHFNLSSCRYA